MSSSPPVSGDFGALIQTHHELIPIQNSGNLLQTIWFGN